MNKETKAAIEAAYKARSFPDNTCGPSRAILQIAENRADDSEQEQRLALLIAETVRALWELRTKVNEGES